MTFVSVFLDPGCECDGAGASTTGQTPNIADTLGAELEEEKKELSFTCTYTVLLPQNRTTW